MAITTQAGINTAAPGQHKFFFKGAVATVAGQFVSAWTVAGNPAAGVKVGSTTGVVPTNATTGALPFTNPSSGNSYISRIGISVSQPCNIILYDRLAHNSGLVANITTAQSFTMPALTRPDALGGDVEAWFEVYTAPGTGGAAPTTVYTNQAGTASRAGSLGNGLGNAVAGQVFPMRLASGDTGVRSVQSLTFSVATTVAGDFGITMLRRIASLGINFPGYTTFFNAVSLGFPKITNSSCLAFLVGLNTSTTVTFSGFVEIVQG